MKRTLVVFCACCLWYCPGFASAQQAGADSLVSHGGGTDTGAGTREEPAWGLPAWLLLGGELRGRAESRGAFDVDSGGRNYLSRIRVDIGIRPSSRARFFVQLQDARVAAMGNGRDGGALRNTLDVHQAYIETGAAQKGWQLRAGRQELALGDERLVGADSYWDPFGQVFDAVRLAFASDQFRFEAFTGFRVQPESRRVDRLDKSSRISGISARLEKKNRHVLEPYFFWKRGGATHDLSGNLGRRDVFTPGVRAQGPLPRAWDYSVEMALQRGRVVADRISAWAGHWELGWKPMGEETGLRMGVEFNYASGDSAPGDGKHGAFDDLYPADFNKCGMVDPIAWRNTRYPAIALELPIGRSLTIYAGYRRYWLSNRQDGLYPGGDEYLLRNPAASSPDVGSHAIVSAAFAVSGRWRFYAGYGSLFPGPYLRQAGYNSALTTAYALSSFTF